MIKLTIVPDGGTVVKDGVPLIDMDLSASGIPNDIHALQWDGTTGWIEYSGSRHEDITALPEWALQCCGLHDNHIKSLEEPVLPIDPAAAVRAERDYKLATEVDPIAGNILRWSALSAEQQQAWADYRQALLDIPQQAGFPSDVIWPIKPTEATA